MIRHLLHQLYHSQRGQLWMFWLLTVVQALLGLESPDGEVGQMIRVIAFVAQGFLGASAIIGGLQVNPVESTSAFWLTRPVSRRQVLLAELGFVGGLVFLPLMAGLSVGWLNAGFNGLQLVGVAAQWTLFIGVTVSVGAAVAAATRNRAMFFAAAGGVFGFAMVLTVVVRHLMDRLPLPRFSGRWSPERELSSLLVGLFGLLLAGLAAWVCRKLVRSRRMAIITGCAGWLFLLCGTHLRWIDFLTLETPVTGRPKVTVVREKGIDTVTGPGGQLLWSHFRVTGLAGNEVAVPRSLSGLFEGSEGFRVGTQFAYRPYRSGIARVDESPAGVSALRLVRRMYPADTVWSDELHRHESTFLPVSTEVKAWPKEAVGRFSGRLDLELVELKRIADVPLRPAFIRAGDGFALRIESVVDGDEGRQLQVRELNPQLAFTRQPDYRADSGLRGWGSLRYILFHPDTAEAFVLASSDYHRGSSQWLNSQRAVTLRFIIPRSLLRERLTGHVTDGWEEGLRLHVYRVHSRGAFEHRFDDRDHPFLPDRARRESRMASPGRSGLEYLSAMTWPGFGDSGRVREYVRDFIAHLPPRYRRDESKAVTGLLVNHGPRLVPWLLQEAPLRSDAAGLPLRHALGGLVREEHLDDLRKALERDPQLAWLVRARRWEKACFAALARHLPDREAVLPDDALMVLADHAGPEHHEDLAWHAARSRGGEVFLFHALRRLDGFPYERTVRHAWKRARLGLAHERHVAAYAAELGELEALYSFIRQLDSGRMQSRERRLLDLLRERVDTGGSKESLDTWLIANAARLRFDPDTLRYRIGER